MDKQLGAPNLFTVVVLGLPGAVFVAAGFVLAGIGGDRDYVKFGIGLGMLLFGSLLFVASAVMLIGWAVKAFRS
ncbi:MAG TPA: hypothetical protein VMU38_09685 [Candidatus Binatia bacterium]|nr:hypothetical protein [Candidatus Binatia bacterium]